MAPALLRACVAGLLAALAATAVTTTVGTTAAGAQPTTQLAQREPVDPPNDPPSPDPEPSSPDPSPEPSESDASPSPTPSQPPPTLEPEVTTPPPPVPTRTKSPTTRPETSPTTRAPGQPGPLVPGRPSLGVYVTTSDVRLGSSYWNNGSTVTELRVDVGNTGQTGGRFSLLYTLPTGVTDAGTAGCAPAGGRSYLCTAWTAAAGDRWSAKIRLRVAGDAWKLMPLMGSVQVTASAPGLGEVRDNEGFAVLFPPGPPTAGISLVATEVNFPAADQPATLEVRLRNTGNATATGEIEVVLPGGVAVGAPVANCAPAGGRTRCALGRLQAGQTRVVSLPLTASIEAQRAAPLSGAVFGELTAHGSPKRMQMSFLITAVESTGTAAPVAPPEVSSPGPPGAFAPVAAAEGGLSGVEKTALALVVVSILLVVLALVLAMTSLRRRMEDNPTSTPAGTD